MATAEQQPRFLTVRETADVLRISETTARRLIARNELPAFRVGGLIRVDRDRLLPEPNASDEGAGTA